MWWRRKREDDIDRELQAHLDLETQARREAGQSAEDAGFAARRALGNDALIREDVRHQWGSLWLEHLIKDFRLAVRAMRRKPGFTCAAVTSLGLALGANSAVFTFVRAIELKKLAVPGAERLVILKQRNEAFHIDNCCFQNSVFEQLRAKDTDFEDMLAVLSFVEMPVSEGGRNWRISGEGVSGNYYRMLDVHPATGRLLDDSDVTSGDGKVCVISYRLWQDKFGGAPDAIGKTIEMQGSALRIVGVAEPGFLGATLFGQRDLQLPISQRGPLRDQLGPAVASLGLLARLKPGVTRESALQRLDAIGIPLMRQYRQLSDRDHFLLLDGTQGFDSKKDQLGRPVVLLYVLVALVLFVACANLAGLLLVSSAERTREAGVRMAIGASRAALLRQFLSESLAIALAAGFVGWLISRITIPVLLTLLGKQASGLPDHVQPDSALFLFSAGTAGAAGLLFGILPAWRTANTDPLPAVRGLLGQRPSRVSSGVIAAQLALSLALIFSAGLFTATLHNLKMSGTGIHGNVAVLGLDLARVQPRTPAVNQILETVRAMPGVEAASVTATRLLTGGFSSWALRIPGYIPPTTTAPTALIVRAGPDYFRTLGIPLRGRDFTENDRFHDQDGAAIVNLEFAREFFGGADPLEHEFEFGNSRVRIVGVSGNTKYRSMREDTQPIFYVPLKLANGYAPVVLLQARSVEALKAAAQIKAVIHATDPRVEFGEVTTVQAWIDEALTRERVLAFLSVILGGIAVVVSAIGFYSLVAFSVVRATRDTGIRIALGAGQHDILTFFLRQHARAALLGIVLGLPLALWSGKFAASLLFGVEPLDARTAAGATLLLIGAAAFAALIPAWRATRTDPAVALRYE
jgi:predicted permease